MLILLLAIPLISAGLLLFVKSQLIKNRVNIIASLLSFIVALTLGWQISQQGPMLIFNKWFYIDHLSIILIVMTTFIGLTTAIFSGKYLLNEELSQRLSQKKLRFYHSIYQFFFFVSLLILVSNNLGIIWVGMECATLSTVLLVSIYRSPQSLEAAWKYLILCGVGLAQALLGTILLYFAAEKLLNIHDALLWSELNTVSHLLSAPIIGLSFVFILIGYGTKAGFVPLHNWLPDTYGESIAPVLSLLSGVLLNLALYVILRFKIIVDGSLDGTSFTTPFLLGFGLLSIIISAFFLLRQREIKRLFAYSSIEHIGIICFAFGIGTPLAIFAGLLHMVSHALGKTAAFFSAGHAIQLRENFLMEHINGLIKDRPSIGWGLLLSSFALLGLPPFALFTSEFLILYATIQHQIWLALPLGIGLLVAFGAIFYHVQRMVFYVNDQEVPFAKIRLSVFPIYLHLVLLVGIGILIPFVLKNWFDPIIHMMSNLT